MSEPAALARIPAQLDVDDVLALVVRDDESPPAAAVRGELVAPARGARRRVRGDAGGQPADPAHLRAACRRFVRWLRPLAGPENLTAANVARYHAHLLASGRSTATVRKDRAALNTFLRWLVEHERLPRRRTTAPSPSSKATQRPRTNNLLPRTYVAAGATIGTQQASASPSSRHQAFR